MLGGIRFYAILGELPTLLPAVFVVLAAASFALLADGLRADLGDGPAVHGDGRPRHPLEHHPH